MSGKLVGEVVQWLMTPAAADLSQAERVVLFTVAERSNPETREMWRHKADNESLYERIRRAAGMEEKSLGNVFGRLAKRGLDVRVPVGVDKRGRPTFANSGHSMRFRLPVFAPEEGMPTPESSIDEWTFSDEEGATEAADPLVDNSDSEPVMVHQPMDLNDGCSIDEWTFTTERSISGWTVYPSKNHPSKADPSLVLAVGDLLAVPRQRPAPPAKPRRSTLDQPNAAATLAAIPRYRAIAGTRFWYVLVALTQDAIDDGYGPDAIWRYAHMVITHGVFGDEQHVPELREALRRMRRDHQRGDACKPHGLPECHHCAPPIELAEDITEIDPAVLEALYARHGVTPADLAELSEEVAA